jgi:hypothetical protein
MVEKQEDWQISSQATCGAAQAETGRRLNEQVVSAKQ